MKRRRRKRLELHPGYDDAIATQALRLLNVLSVLGCVKYLLIDGDEEEVDVTGAVIMAHGMIDAIINALDSVALRAAAEKWVADHEKQ